MAAMFDLTELTGVHADRNRTAVVGIWQVPASWTWPGFWGLLAGLVLSLPLVPLLGPTALLGTFLGAPIAVALTVGADEAPWRKAAHRVRSSDRTFMFCGHHLEMTPRQFFRSVPSSAPVSDAQDGERQ